MRPSRTAQAVNSIYDSMSRALAERPFCQAQPANRPWVILGLRSQEAEGVADEIVSNIFQAQQDSDLALAENLLVPLRPYALIAEGLGLASAGYKRIEGLLEVLRKENLVATDSIPLFLHALGVSESTRLYDVIVSILESVDREQLNSPAYVAQRIAALSDLVLMGRAISETGHTCVAWLQSIRSLQATRVAPSVVLVQADAVGSVS
jgi:hypothetical protein